MIATRKASNEVIQWAAAQVPELVGGSADLAPSTLTLIDGGGSVEAGAYDGRNFHFGIREHAMGAIVNGLVLQGFRAFGAGFLIFSDYMKGSIRLAAIMGIPSTFVFTHDSIGLGEDGPTHQPIEQLGDAAGDAEHRRRAPGRLQRDGARVAPRAAPDRPADGARAVAPGPAGVGSRRRAGRRDRARRLRAARLRRRARADPDGHRLGGPHRARGGQAARRRGRAGAAREHAVHGPLRRAGPGVPRQRAAAGARGRAWRSRRPARSAGTAGSATTATWWRWRASARRRRRRRCTSTSASAGRRSRIARAPYWKGQGDERQSAGQRAARRADGGRAPASGWTRSAAA